MVLFRTLPSAPPPLNSHVKNKKSFESLFCVRFDDVKKIKQNKRENVVSK